VRPEWGSRKGNDNMSRERRRLFQEEESPAEPGRFGCPMLVRTYAAGAGRRFPPMRCCLGWALHDDLDAARCRATDVVTDCWQEHPERTPMVALPGADPGVAAETLPAPAKVAGD